MISQQDVRAIYNEERKRLWDALRGTANPRDIEIDAMCALIARVVNEQAPGFSSGGPDVAEAITAAMEAHIAERHTRGKKTGAA